MNFFKLLAFLIFVIQMGCTAQIDSKNQLNCLDNSELKFIDKAQSNFESALKVYYKTENIDKMYIDFLEGFSKMEFPPQFFLNEPSLQIIQEFQNNDGFQSDYWISESEEDAERFLPFTNLESPWFICFTKDLNNQDLSEMFNTMKAMPNLSPGLIAGGFKESIKNQKLTKQIKVLIAMKFYYQQSITIFLNSKE